MCARWRPRRIPPPGPSRSRSASPTRRRPCGWAPRSPAASSSPRPPASRFRRARSPKRTDARPSGWSIRRARPWRCAASMSSRYDPASVVDLAGAGSRRRRGHRRRADAAPGPEGPPAGRRVMNRFNLSEWAHPAPFPRDLFHADDRGRGHLVLPHGSAAARIRTSPSRPWWCRPRWPGATRRRHARADHRPPRAQAAGDAEPRLPEELHERRARPRSSST